MERIKYILLFCLLLNTLTGFTQNGIVKGRVFDKQNNESLPFVNVIVAGTATGSVTDLDGNFIITGLKPGFIQLSVTFVGYNAALSPEIQITNAKAAFVEIGLEQTDLELNEVSVVSNKYARTEEAPVSLRAIGISEIENNPGSNRDISKVIQTFPGVASSPSFRSDVIVRGGGPSESRFYLDGVEIPNLNHFSTQGASGGAVGIINADFISSINYYSGAFPANRGNALSGVFEFTQVDGNKDKVNFSGVVGASDLGLTVDGPMGKRSSFIFSARQSYLQFLFSALGLPFLPTFNDFQMKSRTRFDDKNELIIVGIGALDRFKLNTDIKNPTEVQKYILEYLPINNQWNYTIGAVYKHYRENSYQTLVFSRNMLNNSSYKYRNNDESSENNKILDYVSQEIENKLRYENNIRMGASKIVYGVGGEYVKYNNETYQKIFIANQLQTLNYQSDLEFFKFNTFGQISHNYFNDRLSLSLGVRMDGNTYSNEMSKLWNQLSPRFSASYYLTKSLSINFNTGKYCQLPAYTTLGYRDKDRNLVNKNNNLKYIGVTHIIGGFAYEPKPNWQLTIEGFYKNYSNYPFSLRDSICIANKGADFGVIGDEPVASVSKGRATGFEILNRFKTSKKLNTILSYTYVKSEFEDRSGKYIPSSWDSRHLLTLTVTRNFNKNWNLGAKWRFAGGLPYTPYDMDKSELVQAWNTQGRAFLDYSSINSERYGVFHQLDVRVDKQFFFRKWTFMIYVDIQNIYNFKSAQADDIVRVLDDNGNPVVKNPGDPIDQQRYQLKNLVNESGTVLPTIGIMVKW